MENRILNLMEEVDTDMMSAELPNGVIVTFEVNNNGNVIVYENVEANPTCTPVLLSDYCKDNQDLAIEALGRLLG